MNEKDELYTEDAALIAAAVISALPFIILGGFAAVTIADKIRIKKTKKLYPLKNKDCITFEDMERHTYKQDMFEKSPLYTL